MTAAGRGALVRRGGMLLALFATPPMFIFRRAFLADQVVEARDFATWTLPGRALWRQALLEGRLPQWNPLSDLGASTLAVPVNGVFYPGHLLLFAHPSPATALTLMFVAHLVLTAAGGYLLGRRLGCGRPVAACLGLAWQLGYQLWMWGNGEKVMSGAWVPWVALGVIAAVRAPAVWTPALAGAAAALAMTALAGDPFLWLHGLALGAALAWGLTEEPARPWARLARVTSRLGPIVLLGALLAAPQLVPSLAFLSESDRAGGLSRSAAEHWSLSPTRLLDLIAPAALGSDPDVWCRHLYFGIALMLALPFAGRGRPARLLWLLAVLALLLALGRHTPVHGLVRQAIPGLAYFRYPEKHALLLVAALGCLGALGLESLLAGRTRRRWLAVPVLIAALVVLAARSWTAAPMSGFHLVLGTAAMLAGITLSRRRPGWAWLLPVGAALELTVFAAPKWQWIPQSALRAPPAPLASLAPVPGVPPRRLVMDAGLETPMPPNTGQLFGIAQVYAHETARSRNTDRLLAAFSQQRSRAAILLDIEWRLRARARGDGWPSRARFGELELVRLPSAGRLWLVARARTASDDEVFQAIRSDALDPRREVLLSPGVAIPDLPDAVQGRCWSVSLAPERQQIECLLDRPGFLVMSEAHAPGWRARRDGQPIELLRANLGLRALLLPVGHHRLELRYRTPGLSLGIGLGALGLALLALLLVRSRRAARASVKARSTLARSTS